MDSKDNRYIVIKNGNGEDYLCPAQSGSKSGKADLDLNVCFERDVSERYAGNIVIHDPDA